MIGGVVGLEGVTLLSIIDNVATVDTPELVRKYPHLLFLVANSDRSLVVGGETTPNTGAIYYRLRRMVRVHRVVVPRLSQPFVFCASKISPLIRRDSRAGNRPGPTVEDATFWRRGAVGRSFVMKIHPG